MHQHCAALGPGLLRPRMDQVAQQVCLGLIQPRPLTWMLGSFKSTISMASSGQALQRPQLSPGKPSPHLQHLWWQTQHSQPPASDILAPRRLQLPGDVRGVLQVSWTPSTKDSQTSCFQDISVNPKQTYQKSEKSHIILHLCESLLFVTMKDSCIFKYSL